MKAILSILIFCTCSVSQAQNTSRNSVDFYLSRLNNYSVVASHNVYTQKGMSREAGWLYEHADKLLIDTLIKLLPDNKITIACHVLLTALLEPNGQTLYHSSEDLTETILVHYRYNGFAWATIYDKTNLVTAFETDAEEIKKLQQYWLQRKVNFKAKQ